MSNSILSALQQQAASAFFAVAMTVSMLAGIGALAAPGAPSTGNTALLAATQPATVDAEV